jgi:hypothetical protein
VATAVAVEAGRRVVVERLVDVEAAEAARLAKG